MSFEVAEKTARTGATHQFRAEVRSILGRIGMPAASVAGENSNTWRREAMVMKSVASAIDFPGHTLRSVVKGRTCDVYGSAANLLPNPNATSLGSRISALSLPSFKNLSGLKASGSGYTSGSCIMSLGRKRRQIDHQEVSIERKHAPLIWDDCCTLGDEVTFVFVFF